MELSYQKGFQHTKDLEVMVCKTLDYLLEKETLIIATS